MKLTPTPLIASLVFILFFGSSTYAEIREAPTMREAVSGIESDSLVLFDLDNTVMMPPQSLGGEEWYDYFVEKRTKQLQTEGMEPEVAKEKAIDQGLREWNLFHKNAKVVPVEKDTPSLIQDLQTRGVTTLALTARPSELSQSTTEQLKSIGIDFSKRTLPIQKRILKGKTPALFQSGILLVGPKNKKGEILAQFLGQLRSKPKRVYFIDNKLHHVENVEKALQPLGIEYHGRRHGAADKKIAEMDPIIVEIQHRYFFGEVLSNDQARALKSESRH